MTEICTTATLLDKMQMLTVSINGKNDRLEDLCLPTLEYKRVLTIQDSPNNIGGYFRQHAYIPDSICTYLYSPTIRVRSVCFLRCLINVFDAKLINRVSQKPWAFSYNVGIQFSVRKLNETI